MMRHMRQFCPVRAFVGVGVRVCVRVCVCTRYHKLFNVRHDHATIMSTNVGYAFLSGTGVQFGTNRFALPLILLDTRDRMQI